MQRITISVDDDLLEAIDALGARRGYASRSEALRDVVREALARETTSLDPLAPCLGALAYVYEHETRDLARRLTQAQHAHHGLSVATMHVHLGNEECLEVAVLRGAAGEVRAFADSVIAERGVRLGNLHLVPETPHVPHGHDHAAAARPKRGRKRD
jgi:CopG family nickel-responsive transcriptional regulator